MLATSITKRHIVVLSFILVFVVILSTEARANTFGFSAITANSAVDPGYGESQLSVVVTDDGNDGIYDEILFTFHNDGPEQMAIQNVYFMDGNLSLDEILISPGVAFSMGSSPANLPGYTGAWTTFFASDADSKGIDGSGVDDGDPTGEWLSIRFDITGLGYDYDQAIADIKSGTLLMGLHVIGFADGESESFITPIPPSVIIGMLGMVIAGMKLRKFA